MPWGKDICDFCGADCTKESGHFSFQACHSVTKEINEIEVSYEFGLRGCYCKDCIRVVSKYFNEILDKAGFADRGYIKTEFEKEKALVNRARELIND
jgi:hypothetical protein